MELLCITDDDGSFQVPAEAVAALGKSPPEWIVNVDRTAVSVINEGQDGEVMLTTGTCNTAFRIVNQ